jgi:glucokinase
MSKSNHRPVLALDIGGTKILSGVVLPGGKIIARHFSLTCAEMGTDAVIEKMFISMNIVLGNAKIKANELNGIIIAAAGIIDVERGIITSSPNLPGWHDVPLAGIVGKKLKTDTYMINDASAAAMGEHRFGAGKGVGNLVYLTISTGIGGGLILENRLYSGKDGTAGEIGHMTIDINGPQCSCGNYGCFEVMASGKAMAKEAVKRIRQGERSHLTDAAANNIENITAAMISSAAKQGDRLAMEIVKSSAYYLGVGLTNVVNIFNPEMIIIGGGVSKMGEMLLKPARKVVKQRAFQLPASTVRITRSYLGDDAGIIGAAAFAFNHKYVIA